MFCSKCGAQIADGAAFCGTCGASQAAPAQPAYEVPAQPAYEAPAQPAYEAPAQPAYEAPAQPAYQAPVQQAYQAPTQQPVYAAAPTAEPHHGYVGFFDAIKLFFVNSINFKGRASKSEFWWGYLFSGAAGMICSFIPYIGWLGALALVCPTISLCVRRFHDLSIPWPNIFKFLIPVYGIIYFIRTFLQPSVGDNEFGLGPR